MSLERGFKGMEYNGENEERNGMSLERGFKGMEWEEINRRK